MKILAMADLHGDVSHLERFAEDLEAADVVLLAGDITQFGRREAATQSLNSGQIT